MFVLLILIKSSLDCMTNLSAGNWDQALQVGVRAAHTLSHHWTVMMPEATYEALCLTPHPLQHHRGVLGVRCSATEVASGTVTLGSPVPWLVCCSGHPWRPWVNPWHSPVNTEVSNCIFAVSLKYTLRHWCQIIKTGFQTFYMMPL